ncbi:monovalent cation/H+ antiporter complex subunit F [Ruicaihuangia caeni]|uniref:Monovalent cation/H+ antiporter complex subunit F n=1 Tax=Ruicaihuangia caeni TaxID=3042517 RepID=A0AAW6T430_9MICO|nr:monovalent cation/H+ antiporter complex subunit F [Klugiella sp. YN-L-19]MDI2097361.1 monovalent cation/H+ antiporter complex subunit F [Klugiella sp. YN-L-19]
MSAASLLFWFSGTMLLLASLFALYRIVRGPSILDRMIASDMLLTTLVIVVGVEMVYNDHLDTVPLMIVLASTAIFASISVARYVSKQDRPKDESGRRRPLGRGPTADHPASGPEAPEQAGNPAPEKGGPL